MHILREERWRQTVRGKDCQGSRKSKGRVKVSCLFPNRMNVIGSGLTSKGVKRYL